MHIVGIDYSKNAPGLVRAELDENLDIVDIRYRSFTSVKKTATSDENVLFYHKKQFKNDYEKAVWMRDNVFDFVNGADFCCFEGYAMAGKGRVFDIAETTMVAKLSIFEGLIPFRIYDPNSIKMFATGHGNAGKIEMGDAFIKDEDRHKPDLSHLTPYKSPSEDIVDAYFGMKLLQLELKLRHGIVTLKELDLNTIKIFNRVTNAYPVNILATDFIEKSKDV